MTKKEKQLLLKDLCARLPYGVKVQVCNLKDYAPTVKGLLNNELYVQFDYITKPIKNGDSTYNIINDNVKPYLRPMSSMTEKEILDLYKIAYVTWYSDPSYYKYNEEWITFRDSIQNNNIFFKSGIWLSDINKVIDWLNAHHFDYRGLIPMGLAIEVTKENNPYKD